MKKAKKLHIGTVLMVMLLLLFMWWINNYTLSVNEWTIKSAFVNDEIKIVQISDLHDETFGKNNKTLIKRITSQSPDIITVTGDMFIRDSLTGKENALILLEDLAQKYPVFYVNGEHDDDEGFFEALESKGVDVINYEEKIVKIKNTNLHIYGIDNVYFTPTFDLNNAFAQDNENFSILLSHRADKFDNFKDFGIDLTLSGDTHGGIFRLPVIGALCDGERLFPDKKGSLVKGMYEKDGHYIHISGGLGNYPVPLRCYNRPEIAVIKLCPQK